MPVHKYLNHIKKQLNLIIPLNASHEVLIHNDIFGEISFVGILHTMIALEKLFDVL